MKGIIYFIVLGLATLGGYFLLTILLSPVSQPLFSALYPLISDFHPFIGAAFLFIFELPKLAVAGLLVFRIYFCAKEREVVIPLKFSGFLYGLNVFLVLVAVLALAITLNLPNGGASGVPLGLVLLPISFVALFTTLKCELPAIKEFRKNAS